MGNIELVFPVLSTTHSIHTSLKYSSSCEILVSPTFAGDAGDHSQEGKSFSCTTAGQGKTTASNGLGCDFSWACYFFSFLFFYFSIPFDAPTKQDDPSENKWKFDNSILSLSFFFRAFFFRPSCIFAASETFVSVSLTFTSLSLISVPLNCLSSG